MFQAKIMKKITTHLRVQFLVFENHAFYEVMWKNSVEPDRPQMTIRRMRIAY
jgi:hypothetical protein